MRIGAVVFLVAGAFSVGYALSQNQQPEPVSAEAAALFQELAKAETDTFIQYMGKTEGIPANLQKVVRGYVKGAQNPQLVDGAVLRALDYYHTNSKNAEGTVVRLALIQVGQKQKLIEQNDQLIKDNQRVITLLEKIAAKK
ncbi:MAG TPA: hypothetical protein VGB77_02795 [Abditibacteriaceae bacterium]